MDIQIKGAIVSNDESWIYEYFGVEHVAPKHVADAISNAQGEKLDVFINSGGGDVFSGSEIAETLRSYPGDVTIHVTGLAASAATIIACARDCEMSPTAMFMVHNVSSACEGDTNDMKHQSEVLKTANKAVAAAYTTKSGMSESEALTLMNKETWLTASEAVEYGLVDRISGEQNTVKLVASYSNGLIPQSVIAKMQAEKIENEMNAKLESEKMKAKAKLRLLSIGGM